MNVLKTLEYTNGNDKKARYSYVRLFDNLYGSIDIKGNT